MIRCIGVLAIALAVVWAADRWGQNDATARESLDELVSRTRSALGEAADRALEAAALEPGPGARASRPAPELGSDAVDPAPEKPARTSPAAGTADGRVPARRAPDPAPAQVPALPTQSTTRLAGPADAAGEPGDAAAATSATALDAPAPAATHAVGGPVEALSREEIADVQRRLDRVMSLAAGTGS